MSATLYREGDDLAVLLAELDEQYPGQVRVVSVARPRVGGVLGFFARLRVGVHYELSDAPVPALSIEPERVLQPAGHGPLSELIAAAEAAESAGPAAAPSTAPATPAAPANAEFVQMLLELAARKAANRHVEPAAAPVPAPAALAPAPAALAPAPAALAPSPAALAPAAPAPATSLSPLTLRRQLAELGAPIDWVPAESGDQYRVVQQLVSRLPEAPPPPNGAGELLALVGPAGPALRAAESLRARMRLRAGSVWAAGCPQAAVPDERTIGDAWQAATVAAELRLTAPAPTIVVVATDDPDGEPGHDDWAAAILQALAPEASWALVDATRKSSDTRAALHAIGTPAALVVSGAARTASPASVWQLGAPVALLDGRPATRAAWAVLLLEKLAELTG